MKEQKSFKDVIDRLLTREIKKTLLPEAVARLVEEEAISVLEAILLAQVNKAICGDNSSASFLRDTSGNKLKDKANEEKIQCAIFEELQ